MLETSEDTVPISQPQTRKTRGWSLNSLQAVRLRLARVLTDVENGYCSDLAKARCMIYGLSVAAGILKDEKDQEIDKRLTELEARLLP